MSITDAKVYKTIEAPIVNQNGYLGNVNVIPVGGPHDLLGAEYLTNACADGETWAELCYAIEQEFCGGAAPTPPAGGYKVFATPELVEGSPFAVYDGVDCQLTELEEAQAAANERLSFSEGRQVDINVLAGLAAATDADLGAQTLATGIPLMEDHASKLYGGYAVISMPRSLAVSAYSQRLIENAPDGGLQTVTGTKVVAVTQETPGGATDMFLTGRITLIQGPVVAKSVPPVTLPDGSCKPQRALAERIYVPLVECLVVKATTTAS